MVRRALLALSMAFLSGGALMTLEIVGGRIIAAKFGSHVFVWGGVIGIFMGSLSLGYYLGGRFADKLPRLLPMGALSVLAGVGVALVPLVAGTLCGFISATFFTSSPELSNRWNPLFSIILIFGAPSILLGSITPFTIRLSVKDLSTMGKVAARAYAINALGSIAGTIVTAFILMSYIGNTSILISTGITLIVTGIGVMAADYIPSGRGEDAKGT